MPIYPKYHPPYDDPFAEIPKAHNYKVSASPHQRLGKKERRLWGATIRNVPYAYEDPYLTAVDDTQYTVDTSHMHRYPYVREGEDLGRAPMLFDEPFPGSGSANYLDSFDGSFGGAPTNKEEGNAFRNWVNDKYPDYAKSISLDRSGGYDNSYVKKAWAKHGAEYESSQGGGKFDLDKTMEQGKQALDVGMKIKGFFQNIGKPAKKKKRKSNRSARKKVRSRSKSLGFGPFKLMRMMKKARRGDPEAIAFMKKLKSKRRGKAIATTNLSLEAISSSGDLIDNLSSSLKESNAMPEPQPFSNLFAQVAENEKVNVVQRIQSGAQVPLAIKQSPLALQAKQANQAQQELTARSKDLQKSGEKLQKEKKKNNVLLYTTIGGGVTALSLISYLIIKLQKK
jgi:hypothetical protein